MRSLSSVKKLLMMTLAIPALTSCEKYALDRQMEELCKKDGGIHVYETVKLPASLFDQNGDPFPGWRSRDLSDRLSPDYELVRETTYLKQGNPVEGEGQLTKYKLTISRKFDQKILGLAISYGRSGGDFIAIGHFTSKGCPEKLGIPSSLIHAVFIKEGS